MEKSLEDQINWLRSLEGYIDEDCGPMRPKEEVIAKISTELKKMKQYVLKELKIKLGMPHLCSCGTDSIDAYWGVKGKYTILLNIRLEGPSAYYGDSKDNTKGKYWEIEGKLE